MSPDFEIADPTNNEPPDVAVWHSKSRSCIFKIGHRKVLVATSTFDGPRLYNYYIQAARVK